MPDAVAATTKETGTTDIVAPRGRRQALPLGVAVEGDRVAVPSAAAGAPVAATDASIATVQSATSTLQGWRRWWPDWRRPHPTAVNRDDTRSLR